MLIFGTLYIDIHSIKIINLPPGPQQIQLSSFLPPQGIRGLRGGRIVLLKRYIL